MLPLGEKFGPFGPAVASRHGAPSTQAFVMRSLTFWLIGIARLLARKKVGTGFSDKIAGKSTSQGDAFRASRLSPCHTGATILAQRSPRVGNDLTQTPQHHRKRPGIALSKGAIAWSWPMGSRCCASCSRLFDAMTVARERCRRIG